MAQYPKESVAQRLRAAAREVFAAEGFAGATVAEIARRAGISTGNVYRYVASKEELFVAAVPLWVAVAFVELTRARAAALAPTADLRRPESRPAHALLSARQLDFAIAHRLEMIILLGRAGDGSPYGEFPHLLRRLLVELALDHARARLPQLEPSAGQLVALELAYENLLAALVGTFERFADPADIRDAVDAYSRYHLVGLGSLFDARH